MGHYNGQSAKLQVIFHRYIEKHLSMSAPNISDKKGGSIFDYTARKVSILQLIETHS